MLNCSFNLNTMKLQGSEETDKRNIKNFIIIIRIKLKDNEIKACHLIFHCYLLANKLHILQKKEREKNNSAVRMHKIFELIENK